MTAVLATILARGQVPALDARLGHGDVGEEVLPVPAEINRRDSVISLDYSYIRAGHILIIILVNSHRLC